jgi:Bacterial protein of unknown function (DUF882)
VRLLARPSFRRDNQHRYWRRRFSRRRHDRCGPDECNRAVDLSLARNQRDVGRSTFGVAENSKHVYGRALDVRFAARLADAVAVARAMRRGGVGWYPRSGFIHLDTGPVRNWDLDERGLQDILITGRSTPGGPAAKGEMLVNGPGTLIVGGHKPPVVLAGRVSPLRQRAGLSHLLGKVQSAPPSNIGSGMVGHSGGSRKSLTDRSPNAHAPSMRNAPSRGIVPGSGTPVVSTKLSMAIPAGQSAKVNSVVPPGTDRLADPISCGAVSSRVTPLFGE